jgi:hypothetical protein
VSVRSEPAGCPPVGGFWADTAHAPRPGGQTHAMSRVRYAVARRLAAACVVLLTLLGPAHACALASALPAAAAGAAGPATPGLPGAPGTPVPPGPPAAPGTPAEGEGQPDPAPDVEQRCAVRHYARPEVPPRREPDRPAPYAVPLPAPRTPTGARACAPETLRTVRCVVLRC